MSNNTPRTRHSRAAGWPLALTLALVASGSSIVAHDLWIEPSVFLPETGKVLGVRLLVGEGFMGDPVPRDPTLIDKFISVDSEGSRPIVGQDGGDPAGLLRVARPGLVVIGYLSKPSPIVLASQKFNEYLTEEGLEGIAALRKQRNETNAEAREVFSRCAKALVQTGPAIAGQADRAIGFTLELVAEGNPYQLRAGQELPVRLTYLNQPLAGALVVAINKRNPSATLSARSGKDGRVKFRLPQPGSWLVKAVHMIPAPQGSNAQWASYWASLTFDLPAAAEPLR